MENTLAKNLKFLRKNNGLNLNQMAEMIGISKSSISDYENGKFVPNFQIINSYCKQFDVELSAINSINLSLENYQEYTKKNAGKKSDDYKSLQMKYQLLIQKLESIEIQNKLLQQLMESKDSELKTLKIQVELLMHNMEYFK